MVKPSTARRPRLTARRRAEKGGAGDWPLARRAHHENPRQRRRARTPHRHRSDAWPSRRRSCRDSANQRRSGRRAPGCRHRLRQRWSASLSSRTRHGSGHPEQSDPQATSSVRRDCLSPTQSHRAHGLPPQGLETHRHTIRQARSQLCRRRHDRGRYYLVDLIESGAYSGLLLARVEVWIPESVAF